jgi:hypothetical protein
VDTGLWGLSNPPPEQPVNGGKAQRDSLADRVEVATVTFLQKHPDPLFLEIEDDLYPRFPGLLTPSKAMIYAVVSSYAERNGGSWRLRPEDVASARRRELDTVRTMVQSLGSRLGFSTLEQDRIILWQEKGETVYALNPLASALVGRAFSTMQFPAEQSILVIPGGRASLASYKAQRDPALAARLKDYRVVKYRVLRTLVEVPVLTREIFEKQIASDPLEKSRLQMLMF